MSLSRKDLAWIIARMSTDTNEQMHKYLDCQNEHKEKNVLGLHGSGDQLLLTDYPSQLTLNEGILHHLRN